MSAIPADCVARLAEALGQKANKPNLKRVQEDLDKLVRQALMKDLSGTDALTRAADEFAKQEEMAVLVEKRNAHLNFLAFTKRLDYVRTTWKGREAEGLRAILTGSIEGRKGARASVAREQKVLMGQYFGQVTTELERSGLMDTFRTGSLDEDVGRALWQLNSDSPNMAGISKDAQKIAGILHKAQEVSRADANKAGAWIGKLQGYITRQSHDQWKMAKRGVNEWVSSIEPRLDWARIEATHGAIANRREWLEGTYTNLVTGVHLKAQGATSNNGFKGPGNLAKRMSEERVLHFKSADDWSAYNKDFGTGNLREAVFRGLKSSAENTGLMRVLGPNPEALYNRLVDQLKRDVRSSNDAKKITDFEKATTEDGWLSRRMAEVTGKANQGVDQLWARRWSTLRAWQSMAKLGGAVLSSITDLATYGSEMSFQGRGFLSGIGEAIGAIAQGRPSGERREILAQLGVFFDSLSGDLTRTGSLDESFGGGTSRAMQQYFKWNLLNWWTESLRGSAALSMSSHLASQAGKSFDKLPAELSHALGLFNITAKDWNAIRAKGLRTDDTGTAFITPENLDPEQASKLRQYYVDRAEQAVLEPDADARAMLRQGTRPGTVVGEAARLIAQFKGFPVSYSRQILGREIYGRGADKFAEGSIKGLSQLIVATTVLGYAASAAKDMAKGKTPRDPTQWQTVLKSMTQGGGAGIYGDFLFGEYSRMGQSPTETVAGPVIGTAGDLVKTWSKMWRGDADGGDALRLALNNTPFLNLFYSRIVLDYLILYDIQEAVSPGTLRRMERRAEKENGQTFLAPPSQDRATPIT